MVVESGSSASSKWISVSVISRTAPRYLLINEEFAHEELGVEKDQVLKTVEGVLFDGLDFINGVDGPAVDARSSRSPYLGRFYSTGKVDLFGQTSCTDHKIVLMMGNKANEQEMKKVLATLRVALIEALMNPFMQLDSPIRSANFDAVVMAEVRRLDTVEAGSH